METIELIEIFKGFESPGLKMDIQNPNTPMEIIDDLIKGLPGLLTIFANMENEEIEDEDKLQNIKEYYYNEIKKDYNKRMTFMVIFVTKEISLFRIWDMNSVMNMVKVGTIKNFAIENKNRHVVFAEPDAPVYFDNFYTGEEQTDHGKDT